MKKDVVAGFFAILATISLGLTSEVSASATGCQFMSGFKITQEGVPVPIPGGQLCHTIKGKKKFIKSQSAAFNKNIGAPGLVCNWKINFVYIDLDGKVYSTNRGKYHKKCNAVASRVIRPNKNIKHYGKSCAQLIIGGKVKVTQCHKITEGFSFF